MNHPTTIRAVLEKHARMVKGKLVSDYEAHQAALQDITRIVEGVIGEESEHRPEMPVPDPFALPQDYANAMKRHQLKRLRKVLE